MSLLDWLPALILLVALFGAFFVFRKYDRKREAAGDTTLGTRLNAYITQNYVSLLVLLMATLPVLLQIIYSIRLSKPAVGSGDVLSFWGVVLGLVFGFYVWRVQRQYEKQEQIERCRPVLNLERRIDGDDKLVAMVVMNECPVEFTIIKALGQKTTVTIQPYHNEEIKISEDKVESFRRANGGDSCRKGQPEANVQSYEVIAADGTKWTLNYKYHSSTKQWECCSAIYMSRY